MCVQNKSGHRDLVTLGVAQGVGAAITTLIAEPDTQFDGPKWSPDGRVDRRRAAPARWSAGDRRRRCGDESCARDRGRAAHTVHRRRPGGPTARPFVAAVAADEQTFNLFEFSIDGTRTPSADAYHRRRAVARRLARRQRRSCSSATRPTATTCFRCHIHDAVVGRHTAVGRPQRRSTGRTCVAAPTSTLADRPYSPLDTLKPTSWTPVIETDGDQVRIGAGISGYDVLGYHAYAATATWRVSSPSGAPAPNAAAPDWQAYYLYDRWRPTLLPLSNQRHVVLRRSGERRRHADAGRPDAIGSSRRCRVPDSPYARSAQRAACRSAGRSPTSCSPTDRISRDRTPIRATWQTVTAHTYGYSISREAGVAGGATIEIVRRSLGILCRCHDDDRRFARLSAGARAASRDRASRRGRRHVDRRNDGRPHLSARRRLSRRRRHRPRQQRLLAAARLRREHLRRQPGRDRQRRVPLPAGASAARPRHLAALSPHAACRGLR